MRPVLLGMAGGLFMASSLLALDEWVIRGIAWATVIPLTRYHIAAFAAGGVFFLLNAWALPHLLANPPARMPAATEADHA